MGNLSEFSQLAGVDMYAVPGEAHWLHGSTGSLVGAARRMMQNIQNQRPKPDPAIRAFLATGC